MNTMKLLAIIGVVLGAAALALATYLVFAPSASTFVRYQQTATGTEQPTTTVEPTVSNTTSPGTKSVARPSIAQATDADVALGSPVKLQLQTNDGKAAVELQVQALYYFTPTGAKTLIGGFVQNAQGSTEALKTLADTLSSATLPNKDNEEAIDAFEVLVRERIAATYNLKNLEDQLALFLLASSKVAGSAVDVTLAEQYNFMIAPNFAGSITDKAQQEAVTKFVFGVIGRISAPSTR